MGSGAPTGTGGINLIWGYSWDLGDILFSGRQTSLGKSGVKVCVCSRHLLVGWVLAMLDPLASQLSGALWQRIWPPSSGHNALAGARLIPLVTVCQEAWHGVVKNKLSILTHTLSHFMLSKLSSHGAPATPPPCSCAA